MHAGNGGERREVLRGRGQRGATVTASISASAVTTAVSASITAPFATAYAVPAALTVPLLSAGVDV